MGKVCGIYKITNPKGKIYIGQSIDCNKRRWSYSKMYCHKQTKLYHSLKKYGWDAHKFEIIHECGREELNNLEIYYIQLYQCFNNEFGLNLQSGGDCGLISDETKIRQSNSKKKLMRDNKDYRDKVVSQLNSINRSGENNPKYGTGRPVYQFDMSKKMVGEYVSCSDASKKNNIHSSAIYLCCKRKKRYATYNGFLWRYKDDCRIKNGYLNEVVKVLDTNGINYDKKSNIYRIRISFYDKTLEIGRRNNFKEATELRNNYHQNKYLKFIQGKKLAA